MVDEPKADESRVDGFVGGWERGSLIGIVYTGQPVAFRNGVPIPSATAEPHQVKLEDLSPHLIGLLLCEQLVGEPISFYRSHQYDVGYIATGVRTKPRIPAPLRPYVLKPQSPVPSEQLLVERRRSTPGRDYAFAEGLPEGDYIIVHPAPVAGRRQVVCHRSPHGVLAAFDTLVVGGETEVIHPVIGIHTDTSRGYLFVPEQVQFRYRIPREDFYESFWRLAAEVLGLAKITLVFCQVMPAFIVTVRRATRQFTLAKTQIMIDPKSVVRGQLRQGNVALWSEASVEDLPLGLFTGELAQILDDAKRARDEEDRRSFMIELLVQLLGRDNVQGEVYTPRKVRGEIMQPLTPPDDLIRAAINNLPTSYRPQLKKLSKAS